MRQVARRLSILWLLLLLPGLSHLGSPTALAQTCTEQIVDGGFEVGGTWQLGVSPIMPQYVTYTRHSGSRALVLGITSGANVASFSSARQTVTLPGAATQALLTFWFYAMADSPATTDYMEVVLLDATGTVILNKPWQSHNDSRMWNQMTFDLTPWRGQTVQVYFNVYNDGLGGKAAMFLDDVSLTTCTGVTPPTATGTLLPATPTETAVAATPTVTPTGGPGCVTAIVNGGFESGLDSWQAQGDPNGAIPVSSTVHGGGTALRLGALDQSLNGFSSVRQQVTVPIGYAQVTLEFWVYTFSEAGAGADYQRADLLNTASIPLTTLWNAASDNRTWERKQFDISAYAGQTLFVRFGVNNDGGGGRTAMYLDDALIRACNPGSAFTATPTATQTVTPPTTPLAPTLTAPAPATLTALPPGCEEILLNGDFETDLAPWVAGASTLPAQRVTAPIHDGAHALRLGSQILNAATYSSARQTVTVPWTHPRLVVSFWSYTWAEALTGADRQQFVLLGPGDDAVWAVPWSVLEDEEDWRQQVFDIVGAAGQTVAVYFNAINDGAGGRTALFVDDVRAWVCTASAYPVELDTDAIDAGAAPDEFDAESTGLTVTPAATARRGEPALERGVAAGGTPAGAMTRVAVAPPTQVFAGMPAYGGAPTTGASGWAALWERLRPDAPWKWGLLVFLVAFVVVTLSSLLRGGRKTS